MAIDDNTLYGLTGAQIKEIPGKIPKISMEYNDPGEGTPLDPNNFVGVYGGDPIIMDYSTAEINTGAKWIDGSAIYKKTVNTGALPDNTSTATAHGISNISYILRIESWAERPSDHTTTSLPFISTTGSGSVTIYADRTNITIWTNSDRTAYTTSYTTLYYTKSS